MRFLMILMAGWGFFLATSLPAQNQWTLPQTVREHLRTSAPQQLARVDRLSAPMPRKGIEARGGALQLDSTVLFTNYTPGDSFPQTKTVYTYPSSQLTVQTEYDNAGGWQLARRTAVTTDDLGRVTGVIGETADPISGWIPESRLESFPHGNSPVLVDSFTVSVWDPALNAWTPALRNVTFFDDQDRPVVIFTQFSQFFGQDFSLMDELSYDAAGDNHLTIQSVLEQNVWIPFTRIESEFEQHREVLRTTFGIAGDSSFIPQNKVETEYTASGKIGVSRNYAWDFGTFTWELEQTLAYLYDNDDRITSEVNDIPDTLEPQRSWKQTVYQGSGDEILYEANFNWDFGAANTWVLLDRTFYYYSVTTATPEVVNAGPLPMSPNPTTGLVRLPASEEARVVVLDAQGIAVQPAQVSPGEGQIDLGNLPAGVYFVTLQQGSLRQSGTLVKQ